MEILRDNEAKVLCPYNAAHHIRKGRMEVHLKKCRKSYSGSDGFAICDFNSCHRIPKPELQYHHNICPDRKPIELHIFNEETFLPAPSVVRVPISVPVDSSWDDEVVPSYDPQKYCEENAVLRRLDTESAAVRRDFRIAERHRFNNLEAAKNGGNTATVQPPRAVRNTNKENRQTLPPTPMFSGSNVEPAPLAITEMMEKVSIIPKAATIPKQK